MRRDEEILEAAAELFLARGFHKVTLDEIGRQVGVTGPAIYRHFSSKEEILETLLDRTMDRLLLLVQCADESDEPASVLDGLVRAQVEFVLTVRPMVTIYAREAHGLSESWRRRMNRRQRQHVTRWVDAMRGVFPDRPLEELQATAHACIGMSLSVAQWPRDVGQISGLEELLRELIEGALGVLADDD